MLTCVVFFIFWHGGTLDFQNPMPWFVNDLIHLMEESDQGLLLLHKLFMYMLVCKCMGAKEIWLPVIPQANSMVSIVWI